MTPVSHRSTTAPVRRRAALRIAAPGPEGWRRIRKTAEAAALAVALALFAKAALTIAAPIPAPPPPTSASGEAPASVAATAAHAGGSPFRRADNSPVSSSAPLTESALNIVLHGTWRGAASAAAVISADGAPQRKVTVGEEIVAGVILEEVQDQFVVISNNGAREAVAIVNRKVDMRAPATAEEALRADAPAPAPSAAPLRDAASAGAKALRDDRPAPLIAAAAPNDPE